MEAANECDSFHLDSDVLLPPRKRLLAGLKRQSSESSGSPESSSSIPSNEFETRLQSLLKSYNNGSRMSTEEIAEAARSAASSAAKAAAVARAVAEEKAAAALKAVAAAKDAMSLVAAFSKGKGIVEGQSRKNRMKKHVLLQNPYTDQAWDDEVLARKLHGAISSYPRVLKHPPGSEANVKHKKSSFVEVIDSQASKSSKSDSVVGISGELIELPDEIDVNGRKRGRTGQKELPLSFYSLKGRDRANPRDELRESSSGDTSLSVEPAQTWKCQDFKVPQCIKPNNVMQS